MNHSIESPGLRSKKLSIRIKSVSIKLSISVLIAVITIVAAISSISFYAFKQTYEQKVAQASMQTIEVAGKQVNDMLGSFTGIAQSLLNNQDFLNKSARYQGAERDSYEESSLNSQLQSILEGFLNVNPSIRSISLIPEGMNALVTTADIQTIGPVFMDNDREKKLNNAWYQEIMREDGKVVWLPPQSEPFVTLYQTEPTYAMGKLLKSPLSQKLLGSLVVELSTTSLAETLDGIQIGPSGNNMIVNKEGTIIYAGDSSQIGSAYNSELPGITPDEDTLQTGSFSRGNEQDSSLYVYSYLPGPSWFLLSYAPTSLLLTDVRDMQTIIFWTAFILAACCAVSIGYMVHRSIGIPLNRISKLMMQGEQGNLQIRTHSKRFDQIGELERSFDRMMDQITRLVMQANLAADDVWHTAEGLISSSRNTSTASQEISAAMTQITSGAVKMTEDSEMCHGLTSQNYDRIKVLKSSNEMLERLGHHLEEASLQGQIHMSSVLNETEEVGRRTAHLIEQVMHLREGTGNIEQIVQLLGGISKQTAILSLNASIEASKAGSAGRGFMVIAQEIRSLADQSKGSLDMVSQVLSGIVQNTENTVDSLADLHPTLHRQTESIQYSKEIFETLHHEVASFLEQLTKLQFSVTQLEASQSQLASSMESVSAISEQTSAASQQVLALSQNQMAVSSKLSQLSSNLDTMANELRHTLSCFQL